MTVHHRPDSNGKYIDEHLIDHLLTSDCSECVAAGLRMQELMAEDDLREAADE